MIGKIVETKFLHETWDRSIKIYKTTNEGGL
jgi:hypothetical protein